MARVTCYVLRNKLLRSSTFRLVLIYVALFSASVCLLLGFIYWSTAGYVAAQTDDTIQAEIKGLSERYETDGLNGLVAQLTERLTRQQPGDSSIYLLTDERYRPLVGNIDRWPAGQEGEPGWLNFRLGDDVSGRVHRARAHAFVLPGRFHLLVGRDMFELEAIQKLIIRAIVWGLLFTFGFALVGGVMMSRSVMRRIDTINRASREIMSGNLARRIPTRQSGDEFDQLADNLNRMLDQIESLMESVRRVSDNIAHDLKTPLARLRNRLEDLRADTAAGDERLNLVDSALQEADGLLATFNALLRIARIESDDRREAFSSVALNALVGDVVELYEPLAEEKSQQVSLRRNGAPTVYGDRDLLFQALANLLDNAIKYTPIGGTISLEVDDESIAICDSGPGIPAAEQDRVFQRFYRLDHSRSSPGAGLGLSLVRAVAVLHGIEIELSDNAPGLCVTLRFARNVSESVQESRG